MVKPHIKEEVNPLCHMTSRPSNTSGDEFINRLTIDNPLPSKPSLGVGQTERGQSMSRASLESNKLNLSCDEYNKIFNRFTEAKILRANPSQKGVLDMKQANDAKVLEHAMGLKQGALLITYENKALGEDTLMPLLTWGLKCNTPDAHNPLFAFSPLISPIRSDNPMIGALLLSKKDKASFINNKYNKDEHRLLPQRINTIINHQNYT